MAKYRIHMVTEATASIEVEAETEEEAIEKAFDNAPYSCHQCPEIGDWGLLSDVHPKMFTVEDSVEKVGE